MKTYMVLYKDGSREYRAADDDVHLLHKLGNQLIKVCGIYEERPLRYEIDKYVIDKDSVSRIIPRVDK